MSIECYMVIASWCRRLIQRTLIQLNSCCSRSWQDGRNPEHLVLCLQPACCDSCSQIAQPQSKRNNCLQPAWLHHLAGDAILYAAPELEMSAVCIKSMLDEASIQHGYSPCWPRTNACAGAAVSFKGAHCKACPTLACFLPTAPATLWSAKVNSDSCPLYRFRQAHNTGVRAGS